MKRTRTDREYKEPSVSELRQFTSWLGKRSYQARLKRLGIERLREIARENGKRGGRPPAAGRKRGAA